MAKQQGNKFRQYLYWLDKDDVDVACTLLKQHGYRISKAFKTPCEVLKARGQQIFLAAPQVWSLLCKRQGSWYRQSDKQGQYMLMSEQRLPAEMDKYLEAELQASDFVPPVLPEKRQLQELVNDAAYQLNKPREWEQRTIKDSVLFKTFFTVTGFWGWGDNLNKHWLNHKANHANFLSKRFTVEMDGDRIPYTVSENDAVCSSCVEFFNVLDKRQRKLVRSCPGAITFGGVQRDIYYDVKPVRQ